MHGQQSGDQFEAHKDQLLTYSFSTHVAPNAPVLTQKSKKKYQEKLTLNIVQMQNIRDNSAETTNAKFQKRSMYSNEGKIIKIGDALFKSNFESGNLGEVVQIKNSNTYKITMQKQINSNRASSWFYFRCQGLKGQVNFIINGFTKTSSLYNEGMKVCYRQVRKQQPDSHQNNHFHHQQSINKSQWHRGGTKISYSGNYDPQTEQSCFQLKFTYNFPKHSQSREYCAVQFAYCYPYEYKKVNNLIKILNKRQNVTYESLGKTYEGRDIPMLTIGNPNASKSIVLSARVHPGETVSSFIMEGFLKELTSQSEFAKSLLQKYLFKVIPMINPDGVVRGNYRFSAAGYDLNRRWKHCYESSHPEIHYLKTMIKKMHRQKKVLMYIDIHGHSRKKSAFFYGCCPSNKDTLSVEPSDLEEQTMSKPKQFPFLMSKLNSNFKYEYCTFNISKDKEGTARIAMWKQLHIDHVYTLESSFCANADGGLNYNEQDYMNMGKSLLQGMSVYFYEKPNLSARQSTMTGSVQTSAQDKKRIQKPSVFQNFLNIRNEAKQQLKNSPQLLSVGMNGSDSGSDSEPEAGIIPQEQRQVKSTNLNLEISKQLDDYRKQVTSEMICKSKSPNFITNNRSIKISVRPPTKRKNRMTPEELKNLVEQKLEDLKNQDEEKNTFQKKIIAKTVNNFYSQNSQHLDSLTTDSLMRIQDRVHSKHGNTRTMLQKLKSQRINSQNQVLNNFQFQKQESQNQEQDERKRLQIMTRNLLKTREGAQYRRVKKIAEEMKKKTNNTFTSASYQQKSIPIVRGIIAVNNELNISKKKVKSIAPSFYPQSQQKSRRFSVEMAYRNNSNYRSGRIPVQLANRKLFINGDDISVHCKGTRIYL